ncbi:MAG: flagellar basal body P-ring formation chaperone FlgA [Rhodospirillales bacterium]
MRQPIVIFLMTVFLAVFAAPASKGDSALPGEPVVLRETVTVNSSLVRLGDLFTGAGKKSPAVVAYAPGPGERLVFDARWLYRLARAYKLDWKPLSIREQTVVKRESQIIGHEEIRDYILAALVDKGAAADMQVELSNRLLRIHVAGDRTATAAVEDVAYDPRTQRFTAILVAPADNPAAKRFQVTGRLHKMIETPVLVRRIPPGEVITSDDIEWIKTRSSRLQRNIILAAEDLIGREPRRGLRAGIPVRASDVRRPVLVPKGGLVTMVLRMPSMVLTAQGRALEAGSDGDVIRVTNTQSNTVIEAVVAGAGRVSVRPLGLVVMN